MKAGWAAVKLGTVCGIEKLKHDGSSVPYVGMEDIDDKGTGKLLCKPEVREVKSQTFTFTPDHLLYGRLRAYLNKVFLPDFSGHCSTEIFPIRAGKRLKRSYLFHWLTWDRTKEQIDATSTGARMPRANMNEVLSFDIPLPPLEEQQRIVAILDEAFKGLGRTKANVEANLASAGELFEAALSELFETQSAPKVPLSSLTTDRGITYGVIKLGDHQDDGVPCLRTSNVRQLSIDTEGMKRISPTLSAEYGRTILQGGEVLVNVRGTLGGVATVPQEMIGWNISREVAMVAVDTEKANPDFISTFIASNAAQQWLTGVVKGATYKGINLADLRNLPIPLLSSSEQASLASKAKALRASRSHLGDALQQKLGALETLRQSLLAKAFAGELT